MADKSFGEQRRRRLLAEQMKPPPTRETKIRKVLVVTYSNIQEARLARQAIRLGEAARRAKEKEAKRRKKNRLRMSTSRGGKGYIRAANYDRACPGGHSISGGLPSLGKRK